MRILTTLSVYALFIIVGLVFAVVMMQNVEQAKIVFLGHTYATNVALVMTAAAAFGFALALWLLLPSRIVVGLYMRALHREAFHLERRLAILLDQQTQWLDEHLLQEQEHIQDDHEHLLLQYHRVLSERDRLMSEHNRLLMEHHSALVRLVALDAASQRTAQPESTALASTSRAPDAAPLPATLPSDHAYAKGASVTY